MAGTFTALITPFMLDGFAIDEDRFAEQIAFQAEPGDGASGVNGILVLGTTGESPTVTRAEGQRLAELAVEHGRARGLRVILGTGANNTAHAVELQRWAADAGADGTLSVVPYYNKPPQEGLYRHFQEVADAADLPVMLYNIPGRCGTGLALGTIERLAEHPNVVAVKHATGSVAEAAALRERCPRLAALSGDDPLTLDLAKVGVQGTVSVISNLVPGRVRQLMDAANAGDWQTAERLNEELLPLATGIMTLSTNPIGVKTALELLGRDSGALRLPLVAASEQARQTCRMLLEATDLLSLESAPRLSEASAVRMN
jgi:4-hydroxy-tetrahydrodipicolinate synthase